MSDDTRQAVIDVPAETTEQPKQALTVRDPVGAIEQVKPQVTAAQAKVEAVASLTFKAYERASMLTLSPDEIAKLQAEFPDEAFKPGAAGKEHLIYIEHAFLRDRLNAVIGPGQWALIPRSRWAEDFVSQKGVPGSRIYVEAMLVVRGAFVSEAVGEMEYYPKNASQNYGDAVEGAKTAALRRCCKEFGIGLQAWKKDWCEGWWQRKNAARRAPVNRPPSTSAPEAKTSANSPADAKNQPSGEPKPTVLPVCEVHGVIEKSGTSKTNGKPWRCWFVSFNDGVADGEAGTFSESTAKLANELSETKERAKITIKPGKQPGKFELVSLERAETPPSTEGPGLGDDDVPMGDEPPEIIP